MKGIIIGGGIAGLTTAIALKEIGIETEVFEAVPSINPVGAGIWMASNAMQVFGRLGFAQAVIAEGVELQTIAVTDKNLKTIQELNLQEAKRKFGYSITAIYRARLHQVLLQQLKGHVQVHLGKRLQRIEDSGTSVTAYFEDGSSAVGDFLIGADGIHSAVREQIFSGISSYRYSGQTCWRGVVDFEMKHKFANSTVEAWGGNVRLGVSSIGHGQTYWFAVKKAASGGKDDPKTFKEQLLKDFCRFAAPLPDIIEATPIDKIIRNDIGEMSALSQWSKGRVCLIGDAVHSMTPNMGQGGGQAVEDAYFLAKFFKNTEIKDPQHIFTRFQAARSEKVRYVVSTSRQIGRVAHWTWGQGIRNSLMRMMPKSNSERMILKLLELDPN